MEDMVVNGLDAQTLDFISAKIAELGFNCIRLPFALDTLFLNPVVAEKRLVANPDLVGQSAMEIFDKTVQSLTDHGLLVILNNHMRYFSIPSLILNQIVEKLFFINLHCYFKITDFISGQIFRIF